MRLQKIVGLIKTLFPLFMGIFLVLFLPVNNAYGNDTAPHSIKNADYDNNGQYWEIWNGDGARASVTYNNSEARVTITKNKTRYYNTSFSQKDIGLEKDQLYRVSFKAKSDSNARIFSAIMMSESPYNRYSGDHFYTLTKDYTEHSYEFTMTQESDAHTTILFSPAVKGPMDFSLRDIKIALLGQRKPYMITTARTKPVKPFKRGIQFGNTFDAPFEGAWNGELREEYFDYLQTQDHFDHIRLPVRWETHTTDTAPYTIDPEYLRRIEWAVSNAMSRGYYVVLNMHHHTEFETNPTKNKDKFVSMWKQIAEHFKGYPEWLYFELYNEPNRALDRYWNEYFPLAYEAIRQSNPERTIIITPTFWSNIEDLDALQIPVRIQEDPGIMVEFHFYYPHKFCMQNSAGNGAEDVEGIRWKGTNKEKRIFGVSLTPRCAGAKSMGTSASIMVSLVRIKRTPIPKTGLPGFPL